MEKIDNKKEKINFNAEDGSIGKVLFSNVRYKIPQYQRPYAWEEDHIADFWNDVYVNPTSYFIGSFVFNYDTMEKEDYLEVIDGQQRLLTITIFMSVLRDLSRELGDTNRAGRIQRQCICIEDRRGNQTFRIICGESTKNFFEKYVQEENKDIINSNPSNKEEKRIKNNYIYLKNVVSNELEKYQEKVDKLEFIQDLWDRISEIATINIGIDNEENAYEIFETVNVRGLELSIADLLKNLIFKKIYLKNPNKKDEIKEKWNQIEENIKETETELKKFLRYYWLSKYSFVTEKRLFKEIKREVGDYEKFLDELNHSSSLYNQLIELNQDDWYEIKDGGKIYKSLQGTKILGVSQCYVLFLSILRNINKLGTNPAKIFELIEKFTFEYAHVCNLPGNKVERIYSKYAIKLEETVKEERDVHKKVQVIFNDIEKELKKLKPSFNQFNASFLEIRYKNSEQNRVFVKYILQKINKTLSSGEHDIDFSIVNTEHILPQKPNSEWNLSKKTIKNYVDSLGNLTLVHKHINSKGGNKSIKDKIEFLKKSDIYLTKKLVEEIVVSNYIWNEEKITKRSEQLSKVSYDNVWSF